MQPPKKAGFSPGAPEAQRGIAPLHDFRHSRPCHQLWPRPARQPAPAASYLLPATRSFLVKLFTPLTKVFSFIPQGFQAIKVGAVRPQTWYSKNREDF